MKKNNLESIILGGGCFWCTEAGFLVIKGVKKVTSGYAGGTKVNPTYEEVSTGETGHAEVIKVEYNPKEINLEKILDVFFTLHDPTSLNMQGADIGTQYRSIILYNILSQKMAIKKYIEKIKANYKKPIVTEIAKLKKFYPAESYHKDYYAKHQNQPYSRLVIEPKIKKIEKNFGK